jgi:hypothetical protein
MPPLAPWLLLATLADGPAASVTSMKTSAVAEESPEALDAEAARLIEEAERAYRVRDFGTTIERLDRAYRLTGATALLYDLGDAHARYYELDRNPDHLRQARAFFRTYARRAEAAKLDPGDARERVAALNRRIEAVPATVPAAAPKLPPAVDPAERRTSAAACPEPDGPAVDDAGERSDDQVDERSAERSGDRADDRSGELSVGLIAGGVALLVPGVVMGAVYSAEGRRRTLQLEELTTLGAYDDCAIGCEALEQELARERGRGLVTSRVAATGIALGALGGALTIAGVSLAIVRAKRRRGGGRASEVSLAPNIGGLSLVGRF